MPLALTTLEGINFPIMRTPLTTLSAVPYPDDICPLGGSSRRRRSGGFARRTARVARRTARTVSRSGIGKTVIQTAKVGAVTAANAVAPGSGTAALATARAVTRAAKRKPAATTTTATTATTETGSNKTRNGLLVVGLGVALLILFRKGGK